MQNINIRHISKIRFIKYCCIFIVLTSIIFTSCGKKNNNNKIETGTDIGNENSQVEITFLNVGKGDCILIKSNSKTFLIDTGYKDTASYVIDYLESENISSIDGLIITHFDKDHVGGAAKIIKNIDVKNIYEPNYSEDSSFYDNYKKAISKKNLDDKVVTVKSDLSIECSGFSMTIYAGEQSSYNDVNDFSLVTRFVNGDNSILFAGDVETQRIKELVDRGGFESQLLKIPHHGFLSKYTSKFIDMVSPEYAVITCEDKDSVSNEVIDLLNNKNVKVFYTCDGEVKCISNGSNPMTFTQ